jgi:hypothetical protein
VLISLNSYTSDLTPEISKTILCDWSSLTLNTVTDLLDTIHRTRNYNIFVNLHKLHNSLRHATSFSARLHWLLPGNCSLQCRLLRFRVDVLTVSATGSFSRTVKLLLARPSLYSLRADPTENTASNSSAVACLRCCSHVIWLQWKRVHSAVASQRQSLLAPLFRPFQPSCHSINSLRPSGYYTYHLRTTCGGGFEYLHRSPASCSWLRKGNPVPGGHPVPGGYKYGNLALEVVGVSNLRQ